MLGQLGLFDQHEADDEPTRTTSRAPWPRMPRGLHGSHGVVASTRTKGLVAGERGGCKKRVQAVEHLGDEGGPLARSQGPG